MVTPAIQDVILVSFPFSDLSHTKIRPAIVLANSGRDDWIFCQVTSKPYGDANAIPLEDKNFSRGSLKIQSYARPGKLFTANQSLMKSQVGTLNRESFDVLIESVINIFRPTSEQNAKS